VLRGPPISGEAHLHLWRWDVQVVFGPPPTPARSLNLREFVRMIKNLPLDADDATEAKVHDLLVRFTGGLVVTDGVAGDVKKSQSVLVRGAQLRFEVQSRMPILTAHVGGHDPDVMIPTSDGKGTVKPRLFARPMQLANELHQSKLEIVLKRKTAVAEVVLDVEPIVKNVPPSIWGACKVFFVLSLSLLSLSLFFFSSFCFTLFPPSYSLISSSSFLFVLHIFLSIAFHSSPHTNCYVLFFQTRAKRTFRLSRRICSHT
jgi:hypothetical protein